MEWVSKIIRRCKRRGLIKNTKVPDRSTADGKTHKNLPIYQTHAHYCLFIPELLIYIFEFLLREDIISASLVCHAWHQWARPASWSVHPVSLKQFLKVLRAETTLIGNPRTCRPGSYATTIPSDVASDEWGRFLYAFRHINVLLAGCFEETDAVMKRFELLQRRYGGEFVPNFRKIGHCNGTEFDSQVLPGIFFSPRLRSIIIEARGRGDDNQVTGEKIETYLTCLQNKAPNIKELVIGAHNLTFSSFDSFLKLTIFGHHGTISHRALQSVLQCLTLRLLSLKYSRLLKDANNLGLIAHDKIQVLEIGIPRDRSDAPQVKDELFKMLSLPCLRKLLVLDRKGDCDRTAQLIEHFCTKSPGVREISLSVENGISNTMLSGLHGFSGLRKLAITEGESTHYLIDDAELRKWLKHLPVLEILRWDKSSGKSDSVMKLSPLVCFAYHSRRLRKLCLTLNMTDLYTQFKGLKAEEQENAEQSNTPFPVLHTLKLKVLNLAPSALPLLALSLVKLTPDTTQLEVFVPTEGCLPAVEIPRSTEYQSIDDRFPALIKVLRQEKFTTEMAKGQ